MAQIQTKFNAKTLDTLFTVGQPSIDVAAPNTKMINFEGLLLSSVESVSGDPLEVSFDVTAQGTYEERAEAFSTLASWLDVDGAKQLIIPEFGANYYLLAVPQGRVTPERYMDHSTARLTFLLTQPYKFATAQQTATVAAFTSSASTSLTVGGNVPPTYEVTGASVTGNKNTSYNDYRWKLVQGSASGTNYLEMILGETENTASLAVNTETGSFAYQSKQRSINYASALLRLPLGTKTYTLVGKTGGNTTIKWRERYYI